MTDSVRVIRMDTSSMSKQGLGQFEGVSAESVGATGICAHLLVVPPGGRARAHRHRGHESVIYVLEGRVATFFGEQLEERLDCGAGDLIYIPPGVPHVPINLSETDRAVGLVARTDPNEQESVELLPHLDELQHVQVTDVDSRVSTASREVRAAPDLIFELIADPSRQPEWDGNDNLGSAPAGQRVRAVGDVFSMTLSTGVVRDNHVVEFEEGRLIAWMPAVEGGQPIGHLWRWEVQPIDGHRSLVTHTYDWTKLQDVSRFERARWTTGERLAGSIERLARIAESHPT